MGKDVFGIIDDFGPRDKIFCVHFRNVSSPLPRFHETFQDDGYLDMYQVMKAFRRVKCTASLIPDHYPGIVNDPETREKLARVIRRLKPNVVIAPALEGRHPDHRVTAQYQRQQPMPDWSTRADRPASGPRTTCTVTARTRSAAGSCATVTVATSERLTLPG